jgi:Ca2+-binding RTX toxin-like protein
MVDKAKEVIKDNYDPKDKYGHKDPYDPWKDKYNPKDKYDTKDEYSPLKKIEARKADGSNNDGDKNPDNDQGVHDSPFVRITPNSYLDGIGALHPQQPGTGSASGASLPAPRAVSDAVMAQGTADIPNAAGINEFFQFFGQALTHDVAEAATAASGDPPIFLAGLPFPFGRTPYEDGTAETGPRQQINEETSFLDLSMVYGNTQALVDLVRADQFDSQGSRIGQSAKLLLGEEGLLPTIKQVGLDAGKTSLEVLTIFRPDGFGGLPDPATNPDPATFEDLYFAGDNRVNQTPLLISQQTLWAKNHNFWVDELSKTHPKWSQDELFEAARALNEADWQHVIYDEYVPKLLGKQAMSEYSGYKSSVDPSIINEWTTVAFRFGHDQSSQNQRPLNEDGSLASFSEFSFELFTLAESFAAGADGARTAGELESWIRGQLSAHTQEIDGLVVDGNRNTLFGIPGAPGQFTTVDLEVLDIQRARDHGVGNYNVLREGLGLSTYASFDEFGAANGLDATRLEALKSVYGNDINKLDSIIGGMLEEKYLDSQLGETFTRINVLQFEALRDGDKFYYENRLDKSPELLAQIESTSLSDIIARNTDIDYLYRDAFAAHNRISAVDGKLDGTAGKDLAIGSDTNDVIKAGYGDDDVYGGKGNDKIYAGYGNDYVYGDKGDDWLSGEAGYDIFIFDKQSGKDKILDFNVKEDKIDLSAYGLDSWKDVSKVIHSGSKDSVVIKIDQYNSIELVGVKKKYLTSDSFIFDDQDGAYA